MVRPEIAGRRSTAPQANRGIAPVKVIASSLRKGNVLDIDGKLYVVLTAESFHPGKGTPTTQIDMRRISDGVKTSQRYKTTEQVERAIVEDREHTVPLQGRRRLPFHELGELRPDHGAGRSGRRPGAPISQPEMKVMLSVHEGNAVAIELPQKVVLEIVETEPVTKGQTASSSYKPAMLSNGVRTNVPPFIGAGTRVVVMTEDGSYVERAKD